MSWTTKVALTRRDSAAAVDPVQWLSGPACSGTAQRTLIDTPCERLHQPWESDTDADRGGQLHAGVPGHQPGKPVQNTYLESFNGRSRDECLRIDGPVPTDSVLTLLLSVGLIALLSAWGFYMMMLQTRFVMFASAFVVSAVAGLRAADCSQVNTDNVRGSGYNVEVQSVMDRSHNGTVLHEISYKYSFENQPSVSISDMGIAPPSGTFTYLTAAPCLEFRAADHGELLAWVRLKPTGIAMGGDSVEIPDRLGGASRELVWTPQTTFPTLVRSLSDKYFTFGFELREIGGIHYYISTFRTLDTANRQLVSQIAIALSQPYGVNGNSLVYHVQFVLRDRPRLSSTFRYGDDVGSETRDAGQKFASKLTGELSVQGGQK